MNVNDTKAARLRAFTDWFAKRHAPQVSAAASALVCGKPVLLSYDSAGADESCLVVAVVDAGKLRIIDVEHGA